MSRPKHKKRSKKRKRSKHHRHRAGQKRQVKQKRRSKRNSKRSAERPALRDDPRHSHAASHSHAPRHHTPRLPDVTPSEPDPVQAQRGVATWVPPGGRIVVQGRSIAGGMVYVGSDVPSVGEYWIEPCLIDPDLPVDWRHADWHGTAIHDSLSYDEMDPRARAGYLTWLTGGRRDEQACMVHVFLFLYGIERRLLADLGCDIGHPEITDIVSELAGLLTVYGDHEGFAGQVGDLLFFLDGLVCARTDIEPPPRLPDSKSWRSRLATRIGVAKYVGNGSRIPAEWALSYLHHHPETKLRTAANRCPDAFDELFKARYEARFRGGIKTRRPARNLRLVYPAASHGFGGLLVFPLGSGTRKLAGGLELGYDREVAIDLDGIPDMTAAPSLIEKLRSLAEECTDELDAYSRFIGRYPGAARTAGAAALLPDVLLASHGGPIVDDLRSWTSEMLDGKPAAVVPLDELVQRLSPGRTDKLTKRDARFLASLLGKIGAGMEPDVRFGAPTPRPGTSAVLFPLPPGAAERPSDAYTAAMPLVHLAAVVAGADGNISADQRRFVLDHLEEVHGLDTAERRRVWSHLEFLTTGRLGMYGVKRNVETLPPESRADVGGFLVALVTADGVVSGPEITALEKVFGYLGLDDADLYRHLHGPEIGEPGPVAVRAAQPATRWAVPAAGAVSAPRPSVVLDRAKVQARLAETARVSALLDDIFVEEETSPETASAPPRPEPEYRIDGLDTQHSQLLARLVSRPEWERRSAEEMADSFGLPFLDSALDVINEAAMEACGEPVVEGHDPVLLNTYAVKELA